MSGAPRLALNISRSPLLPGLSLSLHDTTKTPSTADDLIYLLLTKRTLANDHHAPIPTTSQHSLLYHTRLGPAFLSSFASSNSLQPSPPPSSLRSILTLAGITCDKPLPPLPISSHAIISFLDLLDSFDADVESQTARVKENIQETHALVETCREERKSRRQDAREKRECEKKETKSIDSDFWLGV